MVSQVFKNMQPLTDVAPWPSPPRGAGARVGSHTLASVHAYGLTHTWNTLGHMLIRKADSELHSE